MTLAFPRPHYARSKRYLAWIRKQPCIIDKAASEAAHIGCGGVAIKIDDYRTLPICHKHHLSGHDSIHRLGAERFEEVHNIDLKETIIRYLIRYVTEELTEDDNP